MAPRPRHDGCHGTTRTTHSAISVGGGPPEGRRAKDVSRSSAGAQGDCCCGTFIFFSSATATFTSVRRMIFAAGSLLISKVLLPQLANTCPQSFAHTWLSQMNRLLAAWSDISKSGSGKAFAKKRFLSMAE
jgi:hypothetical protein